MTSTHNIKRITFDSDFIILLVDSKEVKIKLDKISQKLNLADDIQRNMYTVSPSGYGIHWPLIDEDLAIDSLLAKAKG